MESNMSRHETEEQKFTNLYEGNIVVYLLISPLYRNAVKKLFLNMIQWKANELWTLMHSATLLMC